MRIRNKQRLCVLPAVLALACTGLSACGEVEQTNESLSVYYGSFGYGIGEAAAEAAAVQFQERFPEVEFSFYTLALDDMSEPAAAKKLQAELMSGKGPDLLIDDGGISQRLGMDLNKLMDAGAFWDLAPRMAEDEDWAAEDYDAHLLEAGRRDGKQYMVPLAYYLVTLSSTRELMEKQGFDPNQADTRAGFLAQGTNPLENGCVLFHGNLWPENYYRTHVDINSNFILPVQFPELLDYESRTLRLDTPGFREAVELWRRERELEEKAGFVSGGIAAILPHMEAGKSLFEESLNQNDQVVYSGSKMAAVGTAEFVPIYNGAGGMTAIASCPTAICRNSPNRENAWQFLKILLGAKCQKDFPLAVRRESLDANMELSLFDSYDVAGQVWDFPNGSITHARIDKSYWERYKELPGKVDSVILDAGPYAKVLSHFEPYLAGEKSYEACAADAQNYFQIYASE